MIFCHGFASSGRGTKGAFLREHFADVQHVQFEAIDFAPTPTDFHHMTITGMIARLRQFVIERAPNRLCLVGSSMGGLVAVNYANRYARETSFGGVSKLLLLAPLLSYRPGRLAPSGIEVWRRRGTIPVFHFAFGVEVELGYGLELDGARYDVPPKPVCPTRIIHGSDDDVAPVTASRSFASQHPDLVSLREVEGGHDINGHLDLIWREVVQFFLG